MKTFDYDILKKRKWNSEILDLAAQIHEFKERQELFLKQKPVVLNRLIETAIFQSTEASNKIEGIVTIDERIKQLYENKITPCSENEKEIIGYRDVLNTIDENYEYIPLRASYILQLHNELYKYSEKSFGGQFKNTQNAIVETNPDGRQIVLFTPLSPFETPIAIDALCENFNRTIDNNTVDPLVLIPIFINDFLCIHPFNDGNGRMSRLLTMLLLYRCGFFVGRYISIEDKIEKSSTEYYKVLKQSDIGWHENKNDPTPFIGYLLGIILSAYRDFEERVDILNENPLAI